MSRVVAVGGEEQLPDQPLPQSSGAFIAADGSQPSREYLTNSELVQFIMDNFSIFMQLYGKKRGLVQQTVVKLMRKTRVPLEIAHAIAETVYEDLELQTTREELALKCSVIHSLFAVITALCQRFGEVHLEQRQDDYAVLRVVGSDQQPRQSS